jgi:RNA polymerase sigma-70 factor (ECF subfamily)
VAEPTQPSDETLLLRMRDGDLGAFDRLYARYERRLFGYIARMVGDRSQAEDLFQEVFMQVLRDATFDAERGRFSAWLFTVARNRCLAAKRSAAVRERTIHGVIAAAACSEVEHEVARSNRVRAAIEALPEPQRQLLLLKQVGQLTYREIAAMLGEAEGTIKSRLHGAMKAFRRQLGEEI